MVSDDATPLGGNGVFGLAPAVLVVGAGVAAVLAACGAMAWLAASRAGPRRRAAQKPTAAQMLYAQPIKEELGASEEWERRRLSCIGGIKRILNFFSFWCYLSPCASTDPEKEVLVGPDTTSYFVNPCRLANHVSI